MDWASETVWRESLGIEPSSPLAKASAVLKTVRTTRSVLSHKGLRRTLAGLVPFRCPCRFYRMSAPSFSTGRVPPAQVAGDTLHRIGDTLHQGLDRANLAGKASSIQVPRYREV